MKLGSCIAALVLTAAACGSSSTPAAREAARPAAAATDASLRVMTFNLRFDNPADGDNAWPHRVELVAQTIRDQDPDVLGVQEALLSMLEDLDPHLAGYDRYGVGRADGAGGGEFSAIYVRRDRFEVDDHATFWLSEDPEVPGSRSWDADVERVATWVALRDRKSGRQLVVLNTHFDHTSELARQKSASLILERRRTIAGHRPFIMMGDLNALPDSQPVAILTGPSALRDARSMAAEPEGPDSTWNGFVAIEPGKRIDYVLVDESSEVQRHLIVDRLFESRFPSDHLPIVVDLVVRHQPGA